MVRLPASKSVSERWPNCPKTAWPIKPVQDRGSFQADDSSNVECGIISGLRNADLLICRSHAPLHFSDIRAALKQLCRQSDRNVRHCRSQKIDWNRGKMKLRRRFADENCQRMLVLRSLYHDVRSLHACLVKLRLCLGYVCLGGRPAHSMLWWLPIKASRLQV